jgi:hypothetical protein
MKDEVVVKWRCTAPKRNGEGQFNRIILCSKDAVYNEEFGWICDCGRWTKGEDVYHKTLKMGIRERANCRKLRKGIDIDSIMQFDPEPEIRCLKDKSICNSCEVIGCPCSVRFDDNYFELGYIETNLPMCPHVSYRKAKR